VLECRAGVPSSQPGWPSLGRLLGCQWAEKVKSAAPMEVGEVVPYLERAYATLAWGGFEGVGNIRSAQLPPDADMRKQLT
jgi:hypothetical protein